jgi:hypothetical protein
MVPAMWSLLLKKDLGEILFKQNGFESYSSFSSFIDNCLYSGVECLLCLWSIMF